MNRKSFLRNCLMAAAISICPKSLLPSMGEIEEDQYISLTYNFNSGDMWVDQGSLFAKIGEHIVMLHGNND